MFKRLPRPIANLRRRATSPDRGLGVSSFATCRASPASDPVVASDTTARYRYGLAASEDLPDHPSANNSRFVIEGFPKIVAHARIALAVGTVGLLAVMAMACGNESTPTPAGQPQQADHADSTAAPETRAGNVSTPAPTAVATSPAQPNADARQDTSGRAASTAPAATPATSDAATSSGAGAAITPEQAKKAEDHYEVARRYIGHKRYHRILHSVNQAIASNPDLAEAYTLRGLARAGLHDYEGALEDLNHAIDLGADNSISAQVLRSYAHSALGDYDQAVEDAANAKLAASALHDHPIQVDIGLALFIARYRKGEAAQIYRTIGGDAFGEKHYGLSNLFFGIQDLGQDLSQVQEIDASLLLQPDDAQLYDRRAFFHHRMGWVEKAAEDFAKAIELHGNDAPMSLYTNLARAQLELGEHEQVVATLGHVDLGSDAEASAILAYTHLRLGQAEDAMRSINAIDYGFGAPTRGRQSGHEHWMEDLSFYPPESQRLFVGHLMLKGAVLAANGDYDEGVKYISIVECAEEPWQNRRFNDIPDEIMRSRESVLRGYWDDPLPTYIVTAQQELSEWCGYPAELAADPEAAVWATALTANLGDSTISHGLFSVTSIDPFAIESDEAGLLLFMARRYALEPYFSEETVSAVDRAIELEPEIAEAHRIKAELYLTTFPAQGYDDAVEAWETYEALANPEPEVAAKYHFIRGGALAERGRKAEAQTAYQKAFELGYDEEDVRQALVDLNR